MNGKVFISFVGLASAAEPVAAEPVAAEPVAAELVAAEPVAAPVKEFSAVNSCQNELVQKSDLLQVMNDSKFSKLNNF